MERDEVLELLDGVMAGLERVREFGRSDAGQPANAPWLTGTTLDALDEAAGAVGGALDEIEAAEVLGDDAGAIEPGTPYVPAPPRSTS